MRHYKKFDEESIEFHGLSLKERIAKDPGLALKIIMGFSNRIELLEDYITEYTSTDGTRIGYKYPYKKREG